VQAAEEGKNDKMQVRNWEEGTSATLRSTRSSCVVSSCSPIGSSHASWLFHPISIEISMDKPGKLLSIHRPGPEASLASSQCLLLSSGVVDLDWQVDHLYITYPVAFSISSFVLWPVVTGGAWNWIVLLRTLRHLPSTVVTWRALFLSIWHRVLFSRLHVSSCPDRVSLGRCAHLFLLQCLWPYFRWGFLVSISIHSFIRSPHRVVRRGGTSYMRNQCGLPQVHHRDSFHTTIISF